MAKKNNAVGLSALLLGFSVGTLGDVGGAEVEKMVNYTPQVGENKEEKQIEGASLDLKSTSIDASLWDNAGGFLATPNKKEDDVVYVAASNPESENESYTEMINSLLGNLDIGDGFSK